MTRWLSARWALLLLWGTAAFAFTINAVFVLGNRLFEWRPDKISADMGTTLLLAANSGLFALLSAALFATLARRSKWFLSTYWFSVLAVLLWVLCAVEPSRHELLGLALAFGVAATFGVLLQIIRHRLT